MYDKKGPANIALQPTGTDAARNVLRPLRLLAMPAAECGVGPAEVVARNRGP